LTEQEKIDGAWQVYLYARDLLAKRMSYGMVAQSMLLIAFSIMASSRGRDDLFLAFFQSVFAILGIIYSTYQYFMVRNLNDKIQYIQNKYLVGEGLIFADYLQYHPRQRVSREIRQSLIIIVFLVAWVILLMGGIALTPS
jgi:hypothetical protein